MRVKVDIEKCEAYAECVFAAGEVFELDDDADTVTVLQEEPPEELRKKVLEAARVCPVQAITVED
jgi:ferredoxin